MAGFRAIALDSQMTGLSAHGNRLLAALPPEELLHLAPYLEELELTRGHVLFEPDEPPRHAYFPQDSMISLVITMRDGRTAEVATVGREGVAGKAGFGADGSVARGIVQIPGRATRVGAGRLRAVVAQSEALRDILQRHAEALYGQTAQSAACYALHPAEARCCRFVLQAHDRARGDVLGLTQELLAEMLGVQRSTVSLVAGAVQRAGLIRYSRGSVTVLDRAGLEEASCECYGAIRRRFERLLPHTYE